MFGYVRPSDDRLSERDRDAFRAAYCGLCHTLGRRYGLAGRMILNYDLTFLAMVLSDGEGETCLRRCAVHPIRRRCCAANDPALDTAADRSGRSVRRWTPRRTPLHRCWRWRPTGYRSLRGVG